MTRRSRATDALARGSSSVLSRRHLPNQAQVRSTIPRCGSRMKVVAPGGLATPSNSSPGRRAVENDRARLGIATGSKADLIPQLLVQPIQGAVTAPLPEVRPDRRPRGQIVRDAALGSTGVHHIQHPVDDLSQIDRARASSRLRRWQEQLEHGPPGVCNNTCVSHIYDGRGAWSMG